MDKVARKVMKILNIEENANVATLEDDSSTMMLELLFKLEIHSSLPETGLILFNWLIILFIFNPQLEAANIAISKFFIWKYPIRGIFIV